MCISDFIGQRMQRPGPLGGVGLRTPGCRSKAFYLVASITIGQRVMNAAAALGHPLDRFPDEPDAVRVRADLEEIVISVICTGNVSFNDAALLAYKQGQWSNDTCVGPLFSKPVLARRRSGLFRSAYPARD